MGLAAALWAAAASVARNLFDHGVAPLELVEARAVIAAAGLALLPVSWRRVKTARPLDTVGLGLAIALVNLAYYVAIDRLAIAVAIVLQYSAPALVVIWAATVARRKPSREVVLALVGALLGVVLISEITTRGIGELDRLGLAMGLASAALFATYTLLSERAEAVYGPAGALFRGFMVATVFWVVVQVPRGWPSDLFRSENIGAVLFVGIGGTLVPFLLYVWGIGRIRAERASITATLEPVLAAVFAWLWLEQDLSAVQVGGGILVIVSVLSLQIRRARPPSPPTRRGADLSTERT